MELGSRMHAMRFLISLFLVLVTTLKSQPFEQFFSSKPSKVGYLHLDKDHAIDPSTVLYVKFSLDHFKKEKVGVVVLDLDTPGGEVFSALKIAQMLKNLDIQDGIPVIAYIDNWAISAGAMLAYACRFIGSTNAASMGAAEPVMVDAGGQMSSASEKVNSALRSEFSNLAQFWGRDPNLAEAMVDKDIILVLREGKIVKLDDEGQKKKSDRLITAKGKLLTLNAVQLKEYQVADFEASSLKEHPLFQGTEFVSYHNWKIDFFGFLSHPAVSSFLLMGLILGIYFEIQHPGLTFPIVGALSCLGLILLSKFSMETIHWIETIILLSGLTLLVLELFVFPTFGFGGIVGIILTVFGLITLMLPHFDTVEFFPSLNLAAMAIIDQLAWICGTLIVGCVLIGLIARRMVRKFVLTSDQQGFQASTYDTDLIGKEGMAFSDLKPSGHIMVEERLVQALSETGYIVKGIPIVIVGGKGANFIVKQKESS